MSLADEIRAAAKRMQQQKTVDAKKKTSTKSSRSPRSRSTEWKKEDEIIALYLYRCEASKFLKENYSKKRKISVRAMAMRMAVFEGLHKDKRRVDMKAVNPQTQQVFDEFGHIDVVELKDIVISILRGEYNVDPKAAAPAQTEASEESVSTVSEPATEVAANDQDSDDSDPA